MNKFILAVKRFMGDEEGVTAIEYGLIAALIAVVIIVAAALVGTRLTCLFNRVASCLISSTSGTCQTVCPQQMLGYQVYGLDVLRTGYLDHTLKLNTLKEFTMKNLILGLKRFIDDEQGVTAIEYGLIAALIAVTIIVAAALVGTRLTCLFNRVADCFVGSGNGTCQTACPQWLLDSQSYGLDVLKSDAPLGP